LSDFESNYRSIKESAALLPQPLESIFLLVTEITETFFADFNYGKSDTKKMMPFCKMSVEKYIFDKLYDNVFDMYKLKYDKENDKYNKRSKAIVDHSNPV